MPSSHYRLLVLCMYTIPTEIKRKAAHGKEDFDRFYFGLFFQKYSMKELLYYNRFFYGWIRYLDTRLPLSRGTGKKVLEIGCGIGAFARILHERGFGVLATDISSFIITRAKALQPDIKFSKLDIENPPKKSNYYDYIFSFEVIEHLKNPKLALVHMKKNLKNEGILVISTPLPTPLVLSDPMHKQVHSPEYWKQMAASVGFKIIACEAVSFVPFLYRFSSILSWPLPFSVSSPWINTTCFLILQK